VRGALFVKSSAAEMRPILAELAGLSARAAAAKLNSRSVPTPTGAAWSAKTVIRLRERIGSKAA
jgi:recombinase